MFQKLKIKERLTKSFLTVSLIAAIAAVVGVIALIIVTNRYSYALNEYGFAQGDIGKAMVTFAETRSAVRAAIGYSDMDIVATITEQHDERKADFEEYMAAVEQTLANDTEREMYNEITQKLDTYWALDAEILELGSTTDTEKSMEAQQRVLNELSPAYEELYALLGSLMDEKVTEGDSLSKMLQILAVALMAVIVVVIAAAFAGSMKMGRELAKGIADPIHALNERFLTFAKGNLHDPFPEVKTEDEVAEMIGNASDMAGTLNFIIADAGRLLGQMSSGNYVIQSEDASRYTGDFEKLLISMRLLRDQMVQTLDSIAGASEQVSAGSSNLAEGAQSLAEGATEQAGAVEELQATITSITENIQKAAEQAQESYEQAQKYADEADNSRSEMKAMVEAMERINETSQKIENIISEIEDIASQTNLLSLNASIEAARAGEAGRGFAVVADQIRQLAEQSAKAVVDTRDLIEGSLQEITEGTKAADRAAASIETVVDGIQKIAESSRQVSTVSTDQALAMRQAEQGVGQISEVVQANSATAQESSATSEELSAQAVSLDELISKFVLPN